MPLTVNLRHLEKHDLLLRGELPVTELEVDGVDELIRTPHALVYDLRIEALEGAVLAQGRLELRLECDCVRCLRSFTHMLVLADWTCHLPLRGEERVPVQNDCVDLTPYVREDILLAFPQYPLCDIECRGLPAAPPKSSPEPGGVHRTETNGAVWSELNKLNL